jgi:hypothetical protein
VEKKRCSFKECTNRVVKGGVCVTHGAIQKQKRCIFEGCTNNSRKGGVCYRHRSNSILAINNPSQKNNP